MNRMRAVVPTIKAVVSVRMRRVCVDKRRYWRAPNLRKDDESQAAADHQRRDDEVYEPIPAEPHEVVGEQRESGIVERRDRVKQPVVRRLPDAVFAGPSHRQGSALP